MEYSSDGMKIFIIEKLFAELQQSLGDISQAINIRDELPNPTKASSTVLMAKEEANINSVCIIM
jgi:hypothetical protein